MKVIREAIVYDENKMAQVANMVAGKMIGASPSSVQSDGQQFIRELYRAIDDNIDEEVFNNFFIGMKKAIQRYMGL